MLPENGRKLRAEASKGRRRYVKPLVLKKFKVKIPDIQNNRSDPPSSFRNQTLLLVLPNTIDSFRPEFKSVTFAGF